MEVVISLADTQRRAAYFQQGILANLYFWQRWLDSNLSDLALWDREYHNVVRAISFAFDFDDAWSLADKLITTFSPYMERRGHWEMWGRVLQRAVIVAQQVGDVSGEANLSALLARLLKRQSRFKESTAYYRQAIRLSRHIGDRFGEARACTNLGYYYIKYDSKKWQHAKVLCCHALNLFEQIESNHGRAHTENHLGLLYTRQGLWNQAREHLERACAIWAKMEDEAGLMYGYTNLGGLLLDTKRFDEAMGYLKQALRQAQLVGDEEGAGFIYTNLGEIYKLTGDPIQADHYLKQAEAIFRRSSNIPELALVLSHLGVSCVLQQEWSKAAQYLHQAMAMWRGLNDKYREIETLFNLLEFEQAQGNKKQAREWLEEIEGRLGRYDQQGQYYEFHDKVKEFRRSLLEDTLEQSTAE